MKPHYLAGHHLELLVTGQEYFPALQRAIDEAQREILLETYIFADDKTGLTIKEALGRAAQRGVKVHLLLDGHGARHFPPEWFQALQAMGARLLWYRRLNRGHLLRPYSLRRLHRKLVVIDNRVAFIGGINILDDWETGASGPRLDFAVRLTGPLCQEIRRHMSKLWRHVGWMQFQTTHFPKLAAPAPSGEIPAQFVTRDNLTNRRRIEHLYLEAIRTARQRIVIANAYFLPGFRFRRALAEAARRGVEIRILLPGWADHPLAQQASRALYPTLLRYGIALFEYDKAHLHAKVMVVDGEWFTLGSSNMDPLSLLLAREANVAVFNRPLAQQLEQVLEQAIEEGAHAIRETPSRLPTWRRLSQLVIFLGWRLLLAVLPIHGKQGYWRAD